MAPKLLFYNIMPIFEVQNKTSDFTFCMSITKFVTISPYNSL